MTSIEKHRARLSQENSLQLLLCESKITELITVYDSETRDSYDYGVFSVLVPSSITSRILAEHSWDISQGDGLPSTTVYHNDSVKEPVYHRFGNSSGIEPLVIYREFDGLKPPYLEICEEFRFFHRLYHDRKTDQYFKYDNSGNETLVAKVEKTKVQVRLKEIRQFLSIKEMHLSIQFDFREFAPYSLHDLGISDNHLVGGDFYYTWRLDYGEIEPNEAFSRLLGKRLIEPVAKSKSGLWGFSEPNEKKHVDFIYAITKDGDELLHTSNPEMLSNGFGKNPDAPPYLTPIYFRKQVLDKYYQASKYSVKDNLLSCGGLWNFQIDNHHDEKVCAWLGDLGRDLPYEEQLHWRSQNIAPEGGLSKTFFNRQLLASFTDSDRIEHLFEQTYENLNKNSTQKLGWQILIPLDPNDDHHFEGIRVPSTDEQRDFDELVLGLTKILIDSLNEKELNRFIPEEIRKDIKGSISRLEKAFKACGVEDAQPHISFLRDLQELRSSSAAHRKGSNYRKIARNFGVDEQSLRSVFSGILKQSVDAMIFFNSILPMLVKEPLSQVGAAQKQPSQMQDTNLPQKRKQAKE